MGVYLFLAISPLIFLPIVDLYCKSSINENNKAKKIYLFLCGTVLFLIIALRNKNLGSSDSSNYYNNWMFLSGLNFQDAKIYIANARMESGYLYTVWILSRVFVDPQWCFILSGLLFSISICRFIYLNSEDVALSLVMYVCLGLYTFMVQGLRQSIAMSICLFAIELVKKKKPIKFLFIVLLACLYHESAVVFVLVYLLQWKKFSSEYKFQIAFLAGVLLCLTPLIISIGNQILDSNYTVPVDGGGWVATAIYFIIIISAFIFLSNKKKLHPKLFNEKEKNYVLFLSITVLGACFYLMRYFGTLAIERISFYFMFGQIILLPNVINTFDKKTKIIINFIVIILSIALFIYRFIGSDLVPYTFFGG